MQFSNNGTSFSSLGSFSTSTAWNLVTGAGGNPNDGLKTVYVRYGDAAGNIILSSGSTASASVFLDSHAPETLVSMGTGTQLNAIGVQLSCSDVNFGIGSGCSKI